MSSEVSITINEKYHCTSVAREHIVFSDEPLNHGGTDKAQTPHELLLSALGSCTAITMKMYAERKGWAFSNLKITLTSSTEATPEGKVTTIQRIIFCEGNFGEKEKERLLHIAKQCPVAKILEGTVHIHSSLR